LGRRVIASRTSSTTSRDKVRAYRKRLRQQGLRPITNPAEAPLFRLTVEPDGENGLRTACRLMVDKVTTVPKSKLREKIGRLADPDIVRLNRAMLVFLGIAAPTNK
jgi:mRNA interferase MazF